VPTRQAKLELEIDGFRNVDVLSRGVDAELFSPARRSEGLRRSWGVGPADSVYLYVGRLAREKNIDLAVRSFLGVREKNPNAHFVLVGDGPERAALEKRYPDFHFAGMRMGVDLATHYASGDVFLFPSITETFGNVVTEAVGSGLVVVTYDYAAGREHITHGVNGFLAAYDDNAAYCDAVLDAASRQGEWPAIRAAAREKALTITWESIFARFGSLLGEVAKTGNRGRDEV
jgi:glycosyltransferase involved in cell wall biosynthesis